jgi:endonuclease-3
MLQAPTQPRRDDEVRSVASALVARYGTYPDESAGPAIDQLIWFMLSTRTTVEACEAAYRALRSAYPDWSILAETPEETLYPLLRPVGLYRTRARNLRDTMLKLRERFGAASLELLRSWSDADCEAFLLGLPGVGLKVARCTMCFGLARAVLAVDAHIWRISRRLGWHGLPGDGPSRKGADQLQALMPEDLDVLSLHVNLIRLGREFCPAGEPRCGACPLAAGCPTARREAAG